MTTPLLTVHPAHLPKVWRARIAAAKENWLLPDSIVHLIIEAGPRRKVDPNGWTIQQAIAAIDLLRGMPRAATRLTRLRGLRRRLLADRRKADSATRKAARAAAEARKPKQLLLELPPPEV